MSKVVTPPDIINESQVLLVVNADMSDVEMFSQWLRFNNNEYTIHLYHDGMDSIDWLSQVSNTAHTILVNRDITQDSTVKAMYDSISKITWIGSNQEFDTATSYLIKHG